MYTHIVFFRHFALFSVLYLANFVKYLQFVLICGKILKYCALRRELFIKRFIAFTLAFLIIFGSFSVFADDVLTPEERALEKIYELAAILDGKHFTTTQRACNNNSCNACYNLNVTSCDWFVDTFGFSVKKSQMPVQHFPNGSVVAPAGWSCFSFSVFAQWYIFSPSNDGTIGSDVTCVASYAKNKSVKFDQGTLLAFARPGDAIRLSRSSSKAHSVIYVSCDDEGVWVLDNNYVGSNMVALHKIPYTERYGGKAISTCGISITRANNYDTVTTGTSCAALSAESGVEFLNIGYPTVHVKGRSFPLSGKISSGKFMKSISVAIIDATSEESVFEYTVLPGRRNYELAGSELNTKTKFGTLKNGLYYLEYIVSDINNYTESFRSSCFSVCDTEHTCNFGDGIYASGKITYTCDICGRFEIYVIPPANSEPPVSEPMFPTVSAPMQPPLPITPSPSPSPDEVDESADINKSGDTDAADAIYLLYSCFFGADRYPVDQDCDFDKSGLTDADDAIYLLYYVFYGGSRYPIGSED